MRMSGKKVKIAAIGLGNRTRKYLRYVEKHQDVAGLVAVVDSDKAKIDSFRSGFSFEGTACFESFSDLAESGIEIDACIIGTTDPYHYELTMKALGKCWHVLLEKPMGQTPQECQDIVRLSRETGRLVSVCYVLRYHPYFEKLKQLADAPSAGRILKVRHTEHVGKDRAAHTFVRGPWNRTEMNSSMFLAKCCHDVDFVLWLTGDDILTVDSVGTPGIFCEKNAPEGSADKCISCLVEESCPYSAVDLYYRRRDWIRNFLPLPGEDCDQMIMRMLKDSRYGRCVFRCPENEVVDRQCVTLEMSSGTKAEIIMECITEKTNRETVLDCENAVIYGDEDFIEVTFKDGRPSQKYDFRWTKDLGFHAEADFLIVDDFLKSISTGVLQSRTSAEKAVSSHLVCFLAEKNTSTTF